MSKFEHETPDYSHCSVSNGQIVIHQCSFSMPDRGFPCTTKLRSKGCSVDGIAKRESPMPSRDWSIVPVSHQK